MQFDKGYISPYFVTDTERMEAVLDDAVRAARTRARSRPSPSCCRCWRRSSRPASRCSSSPRTSTARRSRRWSSTASAALFTSVAVKAPAFGDRRKAMLAGPRRPHRRHGRRPPRSGSSSTRSASRCSAPRVAWSSPRTPPPSSTVAATTRGRRGRVAQIRSEIEAHRLRLGQREAPGAARQALRRRRASSRSARPPRSSSRRASTASRTPSRRPGPRSRRASSPAAAPRWSTPPPALDGDLGLDRRRRRPASTIVRKAVDEPLRWIAENGGDEGFVVVAKVRELGARPRLQRRHRRVRRPDRRRRHRPGQGDALRAARTPRPSRRCCSRPRRWSSRSRDTRPRGTTATATRTVRAGTRTSTPRRPEGPDSREGFGAFRALRVDRRVHWSSGRGGQDARVTRRVR